MDINLQPLAPLYRPGEQFEISAEGVAQWQKSDVWARLCRFYLSYPEQSLMSHASRAVLHHLIMMRRPERALEIGTWQAGTTEVMARAMWEAGRGHLETIDPYGAERCPPIIAALPPEIRERISFFPLTSAMYFDQAISRGVQYDLVLIDGNHEYEFARFDLDCAARLMRPGGLILLDNTEQAGPRLATKAFLDSNPDWRDVADVVRLIDANDMLTPTPASFDLTNFYLLEAPPYYIVREIPRSFGQIDAGIIYIDGIELDIARPTRGTLQLQVFGRTFGMGQPEELQVRQRATLDVTNPGPIRIALDRPLRSIQVDDRHQRRVEIILAFSGGESLALNAAPKFYPAAERELPA